VTQGTLIALLAALGIPRAPTCTSKFATAIPRSISRRLPEAKVADALQPPARAATAANWQPSTPAVAP